MANAAILATALTTHAAHPYGLFLDNLDVIAQPGGGYGVPLDTVQVKEVAAGAVSSMSFEIDDPAKAITITDAMTVRFFDFTTDLPVFLGYVDRWSYRPDFGGQGRTIVVSATGVEAALDWAVTTVDLTFASGLALSTAIQTTATNLFGMPPGLNVLVSTIGGVAPQSSRQGEPVSAGTTTVTLTYAVTITAGTSFREALRLLSVAAIVVIDTGHLSAVVIYTATVDFWMGLRITPFPYSANDATADWLRLDVTDTVASTTTAANLDFGTEGATVRAVFVKGGNAAGTGYMDDATGLPGSVAFISDTTVDSAAKLASAQTAYLQGNAQTQRGQFVLETILASTINTGPTNHFRAGSRMRLTDDAVSSVISTIRQVYEIAKTFQAGKLETWTISYGGPAPSVARLVRRLTRTTLS